MPISNHMGDPRREPRYTTENHLPNSQQPTESIQHRNHASPRRSQIPERPGPNNSNTTQAKAVGSDVTADPRRNRPRQLISTIQKPATSESNPDKFFAWNKQGMACTLLEQKLLEAQEIFVRCQAEEEKYKAKFPDHKPLQEQYAYARRRARDKVQALTKSLAEADTKENSLREPIISAIFSAAKPSFGIEQSTGTESLTSQTILERFDRLEAQIKAVRAEIVTPIQLTEALSELDRKWQSSVDAKLSDMKQDMQLPLSRARQVASQMGLEQIDSKALAVLTKEVQEQKLAIVKHKDNTVSREKFQPFEQDVKFSVDNIKQLNTKFDKHAKELDRYVDIYEKFVDKTTQKAQGQQTLIERLQTKQSQYLQRLEDNKAAYENLDAKFTSFKAEFTLAANANSELVAQMKGQIDDLQSTLKSQSTQNSIPLQIQGTLPILTGRLNVLEKTIQAQNLRLERNNHAIQQLSTRYNGLTTDHLYKEIVALIDPHEIQFNTIAADMKDLRANMRFEAEQLRQIMARLSDMDTSIRNNQVATSFETRLLSLEAVPRQTDTFAETQALKSRIEDLERSKPDPDLDRKVVELEKRTTEVETNKKAIADQAIKHSTHLVTINELIERLKESDHNLYTKLDTSESTHVRLAEKVETALDQHETTRTQITEVCQLTKDTESKLEDMAAKLQKLECKASDSSTGEGSKIADIEERLLHISTILQHNKLRGPRNAFQERRMVLITNLSSTVDKEMLTRAIHKHDVAFLRITRYANPPFVRAAVVELTTSDGYRILFEKLHGIKWYGRRILLQLLDDEFDVDEHRRQQEVASTDRAATDGDFEGLTQTIAITDDDSSSPDEDPIQTKPTRRVEPYLAPWMRFPDKSQNSQKSESATVKPAMTGTKRRRHDSRGTVSSTKKKLRISS